MGQRVRKIKEKSVVPMLFNEIEPRRGKEVIAVATYTHQFLATPEYGWIVLLCRDVVQIAEKLVEALLCGKARGLVRRAESPFPDHSRDVARLFQDLGQVDGLGWQQNVPIASNRRMPRMQPGEQRCAGWRANRAAGIGLRQSKPLSGEAVEVGRADFGLAVAAEMAIAKIVG
jgi:hypothetical protein